MTTHIKILAWLHIVFGLFGALAAVAVFGGTMFGAAFAGSMANSVLAGLVGGFLSVFLGAMAALSADRRLGTAPAKAVGENPDHRARRDLADPIPARNAARRLHALGAAQQGRSGTIRRDFGVSGWTG